MEDVPPEARLEIAQAIKSVANPVHQRAFLNWYGVLAFHRKSLAPLEGRDHKRLQLEEQIQSCEDTVRRMCSPFTDIEQKAYDLITRAYIEPHLKPKPPLPDLERIPISKAARQ